MIHKYLEVGMMQGGILINIDERTHQRGLLSPLLANIMLDDLDKELEARGHKFVRYADYVNSKRIGERVMES